jgi:hypothetical protein
MDDNHVGGIAPATGGAVPAFGQGYFWHEAKGLAEQLGVEERRARYLLQLKVVPGATKIAGRWMGPNHRLAEMVDAT